MNEKEKNLIERPSLAAEVVESQKQNRPPPGRFVLPTGMVGTIRDIPPGSTVLGRLRGLRKVGA